jgi:hypothetical protein
MKQPDFSVKNESVYLVEYKNNNLIKLNFTLRFN